MGYRLSPSSPSKVLPFAALILAAAFAPSAQAADSRAAGNLFEQLSGDWKGGGTVTPAKGDPMKVACKATYKVTGSTLSQNLRCAGTDYTIHARISGDKFSGRMSINVSEAGPEINIVQLNEDTGTYRPAASVSLHH